MTARARKMQAEGIDVISFAAGEPDFNTPEAICDAAIRAIQSGMTKYLPSAGLPALRAAIAEKLQTQNRVAATSEQVVVSCGAKHSLFNAMQAVVNPGDEVILLAPYWMTYADQVGLAGGIPVRVQSLPENGFLPLPEQLETAVTSKTKAIVLNSPCNPTGMMLSESDLRHIATLAVERGFWIITDEIYEMLCYDRSPVSIASLGPEVAARTVTIGGCSKSYSMTGWRIGYSVSPIEVARAIVNIQDQVTSNATSFAQAGALAALQMPCSELEVMKSAFRGRRDLMFELMNTIPDLDVLLPDGAFYLFPDVRSYLGREAQNDVELSEILLERAHIATVPGTVFEGPGHIRFSYAASENDIREGIGRLAATLTEIRG